MEADEKAMMLRVLGECLQPAKPPPPKQGAAVVSPNWRRNPSFKSKSAPSPQQSVVAIDCEMVSTEANPNTLARVSVVDFDGGVLLDEFVRPSSKVTNYKTAISGIKPSHLKFAKGFAEVQAKVRTLLQGCTVVGHAISHDLQALDLVLPSEHVVDTQKLYRHSHGVKSISLKKMVEAELHKVIQEEEHDSIEDARVTMQLYRKLYLTQQSSSSQACKRMSSAASQKKQ